MSVTTDRDTWLEQRRGGIGGSDVADTDDADWWQQAAEAAERADAHMEYGR